MSIKTLVNLPWRSLAEAKCRIRISHGIISGNERKILIFMAEERSFNGKPHDGKPVGLENLHKCVFACYIEDAGQQKKNPKPLQSVGIFGLMLSQIWYKFPLWFFAVTCSQYRSIRTLEKNASITEKKPRIPWQKSKKFKSKENKLRTSASEKSRISLKGTLWKVHYYLL